MDIVDLSSSRRAGDDEAWTDAGLIGGRGADFRRRFRRVSAAQVAAVLVILGFVLVMGSQWFPWFHVVTQPGSEDNQGLSKNLGMVNGLGVLAIPYYLLWLVVFSASGALVFVRGPQRWPAFGAATGALAGQLLLVLPIMHEPTLLLGEDGNDPGLSLAHALGSYLLIAAFVVLAASLVVAVRGRVFPGVADERGIPGDRGGDPKVPPRRADPPHPVGGMYEAIADSALDRDADIEIGSARDQAIAAQLAAKDHSLYRRPSQTDGANIG